MGRGEARATFFEKNLRRLQAICCCEFASQTSRWRQKTCNKDRLKSSRFRFWNGEDLRQSPIAIVLRVNFGLQILIYRKAFSSGEGGPQRGGWGDHWQFCNMVPQPTPPLAIPFRITLLVKFFKDGLSFRERPPHPPLRGPPSPLGKA